MGSHLCRQLLRVFLPPWQQRRCYSFYLWLIWFNLEVLHQGTTGKMKETIENMRWKRDHLLVTHLKKRTGRIGRMKEITGRMRETTERRGPPVKMKGTTERI